MSFTRTSHFLIVAALVTGGCGDDSASSSAQGGAGGQGGSSSGTSGDGAGPTGTPATGTAASTGTQSSTGGGGSSATTSTGGSGGGDPVDLGSAGSYVILAKAGVSTVPPSAIVGDLGLSPAAATFITGFSLVEDATNVFATSSQVTGRVFASTYAVPTPANLTAAVGAMELAFTDAAGRAADVTELGAGDIGGMTLAPGVYKWGTGLLLPTDVTFDGDAGDVWILQVAGDLVVSNATRVALSGGALPRNVFWQVEGMVEIGTTAHLEGIVLTQTAITLATGASVVGRLFAQTAVNLDANQVVQPAP